MRFYTSLAELNVNNNDVRSETTFGANNAVTAGEILGSVSEHVVESVYFGTEEYHDIINNPVEIGDATWTSSAPVGPLLDVPDVLNSFVTNYPLMSDRISGFRYMEGTIRLTAIVQGCAFSGGRLILAAWPVNTLSGLKRPTWNNIRIVPHVIIDPSKSASYQLDLPMIGPSGMIDLKSTPYSWRAMLYVYDELTTGTATTPEVNIELRMNLVNPQFRGKIPPQVLPYSLEQESLTPSKVFLGASRMFRRATAFPSLGPYANLVGNMSEEAGRALQMLGFSRPNVLETAVSNISTGDAMTQVDGNTNALVLGRSQILPSSLSPELMNGKTEESDIAYLLSKATLVKATNFSPTTPSNTLVSFFHVSPGTSYPSFGTNPSVANILMDTCVSWNGEITYSFEFVCSVFHRATILLAYSPNYHNTHPTYQQALTSLENINVTVSGNTHVKWIIPWRQAVASTANTNGTIYIYLVDSVTANGSTDRITLKVLADHSGVSFHFPEHEPSLNRYATTYSSDWIPSSDFKMVGDARIQNSVIVGGDTIRNIKDLIARAAPVASLPHDKDSVTVKNAQMSPDAPKWGWVDYIVPWYYGWRGSFRYHGIASGSTDPVQPIRVFWSGEPTISVDVDTNVTVAKPTAVQYFNPAVTNGFDVIAPYCASDRNFDAGGGYTWRAGGLTVQKFGTYPKGFNVDIWRAAGDDFVVGFFLGVPAFI